MVVAAEPVVYVNGVKKVLPDGLAERTLLEYLRGIGLRGTKLGCGEGGCGACTVMVSHFNHEEQKIVHRSVNACLAPVYSVEGMHVVTVEGIGNTRDGLHPVQESLSKSHGSQCGFCTPGFVMSMYSLLRSTKGAPTQHEIEESLAGNLCRCTGYRPILDAFRVFAKSDDAAYSAEALPEKQNGAAHAKNGVCPSTGLPCACKSVENGAATGHANGAASHAKTPVTPSSEPIFPTELRLRKFEAMELTGGLDGNTRWHRPTTLEALLGLKEKFPEARIVAGNTEVGIEMRFKHKGYRHLISPCFIPDLNKVTESDRGIDIGSAVTLSVLLQTLKSAVKSRPQYQTRACAAFAEQLRWFAGAQIRNVSSIGGNICTASPISDLNPLWAACGAQFVAVSAQGKERQVAARDFFLGYRKVDLRDGEILLRVFLPWTTAQQFALEFKQAHRKDDDIALVNAGMLVSFEESSWRVSSAGISFGGVAAKTVMAEKTEQFLVGKEWSRDTLEGALKVLQAETVVPDNAPGGMPEFRRSLISSFFFKFFLHVSFEVEKLTNQKADFPDSYRSAVIPYNRPTSVGMQYYDVLDTADKVGATVRHMSADVQVCGEAQYTDDVDTPRKTLHGALVVSTRPHATILSVSTEQASSVPGFVGYFGADDVPGHLETGATVHDEEVFAKEKVTCVGQVIGIVVAESLETAKEAARKVQVEYRDLPSIFTIEEAVAADSYIGFPPNGTIERMLKKGDVDKVFEELGKAGPFADGKIVEGTVRMGGQEHFYLEPQSCLVWTVDNGREVHLLSSTQAPTHHQADVAAVLGLPRHRVVSKVTRIGGGFGGKETRSAILATAAAVPAWLLRRPVKLILDRDTDMAISGQRHPFLGKYKVAYTPEGRILALDLQLYSNAGNSLDLSHAIMERALLHSDNCYAIPAMRVRGRMCCTNLPSNTAFRGFGGPQGLMVVEHWMDHVARTLGKNVDEIRELNLHGEGYVLHYGQKMERVQSERIWQELKASSEYCARRQAVREFNSLNRWRKRGLAMVPTKFGISFTVKFLNQGGALVHVYSDGTVLVTHGGVEMGQGLHTKVSQVAATVLRCPFSSVFVSETSTDKVPNTSPTAASASSDLYGQATQNACEILRDRMKPTWDQLGDSATFAQVAAKCYLERVNLSAQGFYATPELGFSWDTGSGHAFAYHSYGAALSEVEVDTLSGSVTIPRVDLIMDVGKSLNPAIDVGQVEGAFVQGLGLFITEELKWGDKGHPWVRPGTLFTQGPGTYKIPSANDIPVDFRVSLLRNAPNPKAVMSSKAVGEPPLFLASSCFFAVKDAIAEARKEHGLHGPFVLDSPATPERVRLACRDSLCSPFVEGDILPKLSI